MSIPPIVEAALRASRLTAYRQPLPWTDRRRVFLMCAPFTAQMAEARASDEEPIRARWQRLEADISHYVAGGYVNWAFMKWLDPHKYEHWELRSVRPKPSLRVFGRFACPDVFIATHCHERKGLRQKWSINWEIEKLTCEDHWRVAVGDLVPFSAAEYESYLTDNAEKNVRIG
jgi:hypothetical protein